MRKIFFLLSVCLLVPALALPEPSSIPLCAPPGEQPVGHAPKAKHGVGARENRWISSLPEERQATARALLEEALPEIARLRRALGDRVNALADLNYDEATPPETLLQLGRELQETRNALRERLARLDSDLRENVGSVPASLHKHGRRLRKLDLQESGGTVDKN